MSALPPPGPPLLASEMIDEHEARRTRPRSRRRRGGGRPASGRRPAAGRRRWPRRAGTAPSRRRRGRPGYAANSCGSAPASRSVPSPSMRSRPSSAPSTAQATRARTAPPMNCRPMTLESLEVSQSAMATSGTAALAAVARPSANGRGGDGVRGDVGGAHRWVADVRGSRTVAFDRRRDIIGLPCGGPKSVASATDEDVDREGGEQHRDVGDAVREDPHAGGRRGVAGQADRGAEEPERRARRRRRCRSSRGRRRARAPASTRRGRPCSRSSGGRPRSIGTTAGSIGTSAAR